VSSVLRPHQHSIGYTGDGFSSRHWCLCNWIIDGGVA